MGKGDRLYRPAAFLKFYLRFEDFTHADDPDAEPDNEVFVQQVVKAQETLAKAAKGLHKARAAGDAAAVVAASRAVKHADRTHKALKSKAPLSAPQSRQPGDPFSVQLLTAPLDMTIELNGPYMADKLSATFPFRDAPLISQLVRASLVEGYLGTIPAEQFGQIDRWRLPLDRAQIMFRGYIDDWDTQHDDEEATVSIAARSLEAILIDGKINPHAKEFRVQGGPLLGGDVGEPITSYVNRILNLFPPTSGKTGGDQLLSIYYPGNVQGLTPAQARALDKQPILSRKRLTRTLQSAQSRNQAAGGSAAAPNAPFPQAATPGVPPGAAPGTGAPGIPSPAPMQELSVWELITRACRLAGVIPVYDPSLLLPAPQGPGDMLLLRPPQTVYATVGGGLHINGGAPDGFSRSFPDPTTGAVIPSEVRLMVWGQNIGAFKTNRKLGRIRAPAVEVISFNKDAAPGARTLSVRYPPVSDKRGTSLGHKGQWALDRIQTVNIGAVRDIEQLAQIAIGIYHDLARQELAVRITTDDMSSWSDPRLPIDPNEEPDLLKLRSGSPVRVLVAKQNTDPAQGLVISELSTIFEKREGKLKAWLQEQQGRFDPNADDATIKARTNEAFTRLQTAYKTDRMTDVFYCRVVVHHFNAQSGWSADMELVNFLESRSLPQNLSKPAQAADEKLRIPSAKVGKPSDATLAERAAAFAATEKGLF